jgi:hypothetical protein
MASRGLCICMFKEKGSVSLRAMAGGRRRRVCVEPCRKLSTGARREGKGCWWSLRGKRDDLSRGSLGQRVPPTHPSSLPTQKGHLHAVVVFQRQQPTATATCIDQQEHGHSSTVTSLARMQVQSSGGGVSITGGTRRNHQPAPPYLKVSQPLPNNLIAYDCIANALTVSLTYNPRRRRTCTSIHHLPSRSLGQTINPTQDTQHAPLPCALLHALPALLGSCTFSYVCATVGVRPTAT